MNAYFVRVIANVMMPPQTVSINKTFCIERNKEKILKGKENKEAIKIELKHFRCGIGLRRFTF